MAQVALDQDAEGAISKRLKRAHRQLGIVVRMLDEDRTCNEDRHSDGSGDEAVKRPRSP